MYEISVQESIPAQPNIYSDRAREAASNSYSSIPFQSTIRYRKSFFTNSSFNETFNKNQSQDQNFLSNYNYEMYSNDN